MTNKELQAFVELVEKTYQKAIMQPGEACGAVAA
jgi:hypothetical protein